MTRHATRPVPRPRTGRSTTPGKGPLAGLPFGPATARAILAAILLSAVPSLSAADAAMEAFVAVCAEGAEDAFNPVSCACIHDGLVADFSSAQMTTIAELFGDTVQAAVDRLEASADPEDQDILARLEDVEAAVEACAD